MTTMTSTGVDLALRSTLANLSVAELVEHSLKRGEGVLAANGALNVRTGDRTGRSPKDKFLEDTAHVHDKIWWGNVNQPMASDKFDLALEMARKHLEKAETVFVNDGFVGADPKRRLSVRTYTEHAWHALFVKTLFLRPAADELASFSPDWTILNCGKRKLTSEEAKALGVNDTGVLIAQSLSRRIVVIFGTEYAGEMKKGVFYAMNYDMPDVGVFPMHCSANVNTKDHNDVALFFGLSGTGKTTLSADPSRGLIGDDEHGWSDEGVFNFEGGCYAKCIKLTKEGEPMIWDAIRFGSVLENVILDQKTREPDYDRSDYTENTRVTYPVEYIDNAVLPSMAGHPKNVVFLTADAFGVLPPISRLTPEQAMYYFINGYTSKLAGTEAGVTEPQPNFSPCFGGPFLPRQPRVYADQLAERIKKHGANVWLVNTGWTGGAYGTGSRMKLSYTRAMITAALSGELRKATFENDPVFGLAIPQSVPGVPDNVLNPRDTWADAGAYDKQAKELAAKFRANDAKFEMPDSVRNAGPKA
ncbi:MAG: phosphoenolpyruvate carboxykinase (ATP) [Phycisphaerales bacterium]